MRSTSIQEKLAQNVTRRTGMSRPEAGLYIALGLDHHNGSPPKDGRQTAGLKFFNGQYRLAGQERQMRLG